MASNTPIGNFSRGVNFLEGGEGGCKGGHEGSHAEAGGHADGHAGGHEALAASVQSLVEVFSREMASVRTRSRPRKSQQPSLGAI